MIKENVWFKTAEFYKFKGQATSDSSGWGQAIEEN